MNVLLSEGVLSQTQAGCSSREAGPTIMKKPVTTPQKMAMVIKT